MTSARATRWAAGAALLVVALAACTGQSPDPQKPSLKSAAPSLTTQQNAPEPSITREDALADLLERRASAIRARDRASFADTLDSVSSGFGLRQLATFDALAKLPIGTFSYGTPEPAPALSDERIAQVGPDAWVSRVAGRYSLAGFDTASREFESYFTVVRRETQWKLVDDSDGGTQPEIWDLPKLTVLKGDSTLVVGTGPTSRLRAYLALGDAAVPRVRAVWTAKWNGRLVLVVPGTTAQMAEQVGQQAASVEQVAAVTDGPFDLQGRSGADRVVINPGAFANLQPRGQQVVVTHEATHVAVRSSTDRPVPLWLSEGMADYVGYRDIGAPRTQVAAALLDRVRSGKGPKSLPGAADFDPARTTIAPSYNAAWLAVHHIAERYGRAALVRFYLHVATTTDQSSGAVGDPEANADKAFGTVLHTTRAAFTREWLTYLERLAARGNS